MDILASVFGLCGAIGGLVAALSYLRARAIDSRQAAVASSTELTQIKNDLRGVVSSLAELKTRTERLAERLEIGLAQLSKDVVEMRGKIGILESQMAVFWKNVAYDAAGILHSPHEGWESLDSLLDKFREETITPSEMSDLLVLLHEVKDGTFPAHSETTRADQLSASLLLRAIEQTRVLPW